ncbi:MAG TPA: serine/threonine-protein kinase [Polyangia bacterium]|nr:serine/threonine-protein kinase [Polyangia bacterium]
MPATSEQAPARRYRIERYLTEGGMGAIYVGKKLGPGGFEKEVVLKQLLPEYTARPEFRDLFFREAKISATLDHANIVHTFDLVESEESLFIVMEYVRGVDLRSIIRRSKLRRRELSPAASLHVTLEILAGLSYAHTRRTPTGQSMAIIHRDVSPSNILCSAQGEVKLSDFGIAKAATHSSAFYRVRGKVGYMSPEQARNQAIDHRSDLYSVAVCLYEALTLERLFVGDLSTPADVIYSQPIVPPSQKRMGIPTALDVVLATALSADPNDRYQDAVAFADALRQVAHRHGMLYSAPQLGEHLRYILGSDPQKWLNDEQVLPSGDPHTQEIPGKKLEGKEAKSIGVVDSSGLYVLSGSDLIKSPIPVPPKPQAKPAPRFESPRYEPPRNDPPRKPLSPRQPTMPLVPIEEDISEVPTKVRDAFPVTPEVSQALPPAAAVTPPPPAVTPPPPVVRRPPPRKAKTPAEVSLETPPPPGVTPPPPLKTPPPPLTARARRRTPPPPPLRPRTPPAPLPLPESPFDLPPTPPPIDPARQTPLGEAQLRPRESAEEFPMTPSPYPPTPPPVQAPLPQPGYGYAPAYRPPGGPPPGLPRPSGGYAPIPAPPPAPAPYDPAPYNQAPYNQAPYNQAVYDPNPLDFAPMTVEEPRRWRPPGLLIVFVLLGAAAGGAKLAQVVTRPDMAALDAQSSTAK